MFVGQPSAGRLANVLAATLFTFDNQLCFVTQVVRGANRFTHHNIYKVRDLLVAVSNAFVFKKKK